MTNFEYWKDEILRICEAPAIAIVNGKPTDCYETDCRDCQLDARRCVPEFIAWLYEEHIDHPKLTKRERAFCEFAESGWSARDADGKLYWYGCKPKRRDVDWFSESIVDFGNLCLSEKFFDFIKWEDPEPWAISDLLKLEVADEVQEDATMGE